MVNQMSLTSLAELSVALKIDSVRREHCDSSNRENAWVAENRAVASAENRRIALAKTSLCLAPAARFAADCDAVVAYLV